MYPPPSSVGDGVWMAVKDVIALLGLGTPFIFAAATYGLFHWLDRNASAQATRAISAWLRGRPHQEIQVRLAIIAAFDRLYTAPLLRIRAFLRSAALSSIAFIAYTFRRHVSNIIPLLSFIKSTPGMSQGIMDHQLETLGPERFQQLCQALLVKEFPGVTLPAGWTAGRWPRCHALRGRYR
jgi:hypothetical protein